MSLYLTLPSNSSAEYFSDNRASHFFTKLPQPIHLSGQWEVGLAEIQFTNTYANVFDNQIWLKYKMFSPSNPSGDTKWQDDSKHVKLKGGFYESGEIFLQALNKECEKVLGRLNNQSQRVSFTYNPTTRKASLHLSEDLGFVQLSKSLQNILGFKTDTLFGSYKINASHILDITQEFKSMFIYCDVVSPRPVGDVMVPLLRTLPMLDHKRAPIHAIFDKPHYIPLSRFQFDTLEILIMTDTGQELSLSQGHTVVTLHFRRARTEAFLF